MTTTWLYRLRLNRIELLTEGPTLEEPRPSRAIGISPNSTRPARTS
jgi:hypothetical protein